MVKIFSRFFFQKLKSLKRGTYWKGLYIKIFYQVTPKNLKKQAKSETQKKQKSDLVKESASM